MSDLASPKLRVDSMHITHSYEVDQTPYVNQEFPIDSFSFSEIPSSNNPNPRKTIFIVLGILAIIGGIFLAYKRRQPTIFPIQNTLPPKQYHLTGKIKTTINPR